MFRYIEKTWSTLTTYPTPPSSMGYSKCLPSSTLTFFILSSTNKRYLYYFMTNQTIYSIWDGTVKEKKIPTTRLFGLVWFRVQLSPPPLASKCENGSHTQRVERWREREGEPFIVVSGDGKGKGPNKTATKRLWASSILYIYSLETNLYRFLL